MAKARRAHARKAVRARRARRHRIAAATHLVAATGAVAGLAVWGMAEPAQAAAGCQSAQAVTGSTVAGYAYAWGMNWRSDPDVWALALANPAIPNPNVLTAGEELFQCPQMRPPVDRAGLVRYVVRDRTSMAVLDSVQTGDGHWPIPIWRLARGNPDLTWGGTVNEAQVVYLLPAPWDRPRATARHTARPLPVPAPSEPVAEPVTPQVSALHVLPTPTSTTAPPARYVARSRVNPTTTTAAPERSAAVVPASAVPTTPAAPAPPQTPALPPPAPLPAAPALTDDGYDSADPPTLAQALAARAHGISWWGWYVGGPGAKHVWADAEVAVLAQAGFTRSMPIYVPTPQLDSDPAADYAAASSRARALGWRGAVALDTEPFQRGMPRLAGYVNTWNAAARAAGDQPVVYGGADYIGSAAAWFVLDAIPGAADQTGQSAVAGLTVDDDTAPAGWPLSRSTTPVRQREPSSSSYRPAEPAPDIIGTIRQPAHLAPEHPVTVIAPRPVTPPVTAVTPVTAPAPPPAPAPGHPAPSPPVAQLAQRITQPINGIEPQAMREVWHGLATRDPHLAAEGVAFLTGSFMQESGLDPTSHNPSEGAWGFAQWEGDRAVGLQHTTGAELDKATAELHSPYFVWEHQVLSTPGLPMQSYRVAIHGYEGYGREGARTQYAEALLAQVGR